MSTPDDLEQLDGLSKYPAEGDGEGGGEGDGGEGGGGGGRTFLRLLLSGSAASKSGWRGFFFVFFAARCSRFFTAAGVIDSWRAGGRPAWARAEAAANRSFFSRAVVARSAASLASLAASASFIPSGVLGFMNPKVKRVLAICL